MAVVGRGIIAFATAAFVGSAVVTVPFTIVAIATAITMVAVRVTLLAVCDVAAAPIVAP